ncbi:hypothetical protein BI343_02270 [Chromobacterium amazonense]|uniref:CS1-pili formation C-terminal domain-containing protein n=1 Tax=Chromobacterium amazonense TaxID=1382803 RepID=UPI0008D8FB50|nr:CS1-pili formation C-terminal domain-containing protein [Chromobacterium amazonense]OHX15201.1 hypothetical protein BI343_02270 [Chromobacterium amazonense]
MQKHWDEQLAALPEEFRAALFDVPRLSELWVDGRQLGEVELIVSSDGMVRLQPGMEPAEGGLWLAYLTSPRRLGSCAQDCPNGLLALEYDIAESRLKLLTRGAEQAGDAAFHALPAQGGHGLLLRNDLSVFAQGRGGLEGRYSLDVTGSLHNWTLVGATQLAQGGAGHHAWRQTVGQWYAQRELPRHFIRLGKFANGVQGLARTPTLSGETVLGLMAGSSDALVRDSDFPSQTPIQVSGLPGSVAEILRDGVLLHSQALEGGLQALDTKRLPGGIYPVEVRVRKDGEEMSRRQEWVYKPQRWGDPAQRWRYNVFAGQRSESLGSRFHRQLGWSGGGMINYLLHPKVMLGGGVVRSGSRSEYAATVDAELNERMRLDGGLFWRDGDKGWHGQLLRTLADNKGSLQLGLEQQWRRSGEARHALTATAYRQLNERNSVTLQARHDARSGSVGVDLGLNRRQNWLGQDVDLRFSLFDQAGFSGQARRRGVEAALNLHLGESGRQYHASVGSRAKEGRQRAYATAGMSQQWQDGALRNAGLAAEANEQGLGFSGNVGFRHDLADGDAFFSRGANRIWTGNLNVRNAVVLGAGKAALGAVEAGNAAVMIVEVESDDPNATLQGDGRWGEQTLRPGVNLLPLTPYQPGRVNFMLARAQEGQPLSVRPSSAAYHLNRGGVAYQKVKVMRVMTVMGRLLDQSGQPWAGASVVNHAGRTVSDENGLFTLDVHAHTPELGVEREGVKHCRLHFEPEGLALSEGVVFVGDIGCLVNGVEFKDVNNV